MNVLMDELFNPHILYFLLICVILFLMYRSEHSKYESEQSENQANRDTIQKQKEQIKELERRVSSLKSFLQESESRLYHFLKVLKDKIPDIVPSNLTYDPARDYLSDDEWNRFSSIVRERLAIIRYSKSDKTTHEIGRDYEMSVAHEYRLLGYDVEHRGYLGMNDMGVDLIARRGHDVLLIQCKCWAQGRILYEKHVFQLYGVLSYFRTTHKFPNDNLQAVLITSAELSSTAKDAAFALGIHYREERKAIPFPCVKCAIHHDSHGGDTKQYYLPMDLHYDDIRICSPGECFVTDPQEAVDKGFNRSSSSSV